MQNGNRMRDSSRKQWIAGKQGYRSWQRDAVIVDLVEIGEDMVAETRRQRAGRGKARNRWWKESNLAEADTDPASRMDGIVV